MATKKFNAVTDRPKRDNPVLEFQSPKLTDDEWDVIQGRVWDLLRSDTM